VVSTAESHARHRLEFFDHFIRQLNEPDGERVGVHLFFPMTRVERITLDEPMAHPSMDELFARKLGRG